MIVGLVGVLPLQIEDVRVRLRTTRDADLVRFGRAAAQGTTHFMQP